MEVRDVRNETGGIIGGWLGQMLVFIAVFGLIVYELLAVGVTAVGLDDTARDVARAGALAYRETRDLTDATEAASERAVELDVEIEGEVTIEEGDIVLDVTKQAPTVFIHRIGPLEDFATPSVSGRAPWDPR